MNASYNWIKDFINVKDTAENTAELLTDLGLEVEKISDFESIKGGLAGVVVGKVLSCEPHENADRLKVTTVAIGTGEPLQIVCGAPNVAAGQKVPVATLGTVLYAKDKEGKPTTFKIKKGKIRGVVSMGMICAEDELQLGDGHEGIMVLDDAIAEGTPLNEVVPVVADTIFKIGITPNRADGMGHYGIARDLNAGLRLKGVDCTLKKPHFDYEADKSTNNLKITVNDPEKAPRYAGVCIKGVKIAPSPDWLQIRLKSIGLKPINNVVDTTNYVLFDLGQPLHAFDLAKVRGDEIRVQTLPAGTPFITLDGKERVLHEEDLMICDGRDTPMCIAGVFGGLDSGVHDKTTDLFLEAAYFDPVNTRKSAKRHGLNTDASFRFERGVDPDMTLVALKRATSMMLAIAGGSAGELVDHYPKKMVGFKVVLPYQQLFDLMGTTIEKKTIWQILHHLEIEITEKSETALHLVVPPYRVDVQRPVDVIEDILRVYGYNNIPTEESMAFSANAHDDSVTKLEEIIANQLCAQGFYEVLTNSMIHQKNQYGTVEKSETVRICNPISQEMEQMRTDLLPNLLEVVAYNYKRKNTDLMVYEFGKTYFKNDTNYRENKKLSLVSCGLYRAENWQSHKAKGDFFYLKGIVAAIFNRLGIDKIKSQPTQNPALSEGIALFYKEIHLGDIGVVKDAILKIHELKTNVIYADLHWEGLTKIALDKKQISLRELPKTNWVKRDLTLLVPANVQYQDLHDAAFASARKLLKEVQLSDVYEDKKLGDNKSYTLSFTLQDDRFTLSEQQISKVMNRIYKKFTELQVFIRDYESTSDTIF